MSEMLYDLFICHASEDKELLVRPLADALRKANVEVWYDEFTLELGDSIRRSIDKGLRYSRFGIVVLSKSFFAKEWPQYELDGLAEREMAGRDKVILPIWHEISHGEVMQYSPSLAGRKAVSSSVGINKIVTEIVSVIHPHGSPLINARDILLSWGVTPPVITDPYWLNVVEASNRLYGFGAAIPDEQVWDRWSFPLPFKSDEAKQWGERLAWTAMQMQWVKTAAEVPITILTPPEQALSFIHAHPGLFETCQEYPGLVAEYAPQLTIPGMGGDLEDSLEKAFQKSCARAAQERARGSQVGSGLTVDRKSPLCDDEWSIRHPNFGNYEPGSIANAYFAGGMFGPTVSPFEHAEHVFWLLSRSSSWLPSKIHEMFIKGMKSWGVWYWFDIQYDDVKRWATCGALSHAMFRAVERKKTLKWNAEVKDDLMKRIELAIYLLKLPEKPRDLFQGFIDEEFPKHFIETTIQRRRKTSRRSRKKS